MKQLTFDADLVGPWVCERAGGQYFKGNSAIGLLVNGVLKAGIDYDSYTGASIAMHSRCDDPQAPNRLFFWAIFDYPFNQLKVKRVTGLVPKSNKIAQQIDEKLGWKYETTLVDYFPDSDGLVYLMTRSDCRWLKLGRIYDVLKKAA